LKYYDFENDLSNETYVGMPYNLQIILANMSATMTAVK
jgi:hypothetical protein